MTECPRITYQSSKRTFERLFKEQSLDETKNVVRKKLGLGHDAAVELAQLRDGRRIDLEDDDDFEAFKALTKTSLHATVVVVIPKDGHSSSAPVRRRRVFQWKGEETVMALMLSPAQRMPRTLAWLHLS
jgi:hypothetical protein